MKKSWTSILFLLCTLPVMAQYQTSATRTYDRYPPETQEGGFGVHISEVVQMDDDANLEEVFLFSKNNGHYPEFDLFLQYIAVVDYYTKELKYKSDIVLSNERTLLLEDRNQDGKYEAYRTYFKDSDFKVDEYGEKLRVTWAYDSIECK